jgi:hypothetical protein
VEDLQQKQQQTDVKLEQLSQSAQEALKRAQEAGVLAKGKVVFEQSFSEDRIKFALDKYELDANAKTALDEFAEPRDGTRPQYFIEIQGHTDDTGGERYNEELGQRRADAVRRYLSREHKLPLAACRRSRTATPCRRIEQDEAPAARRIAAWFWSSSSSRFATCCRKGRRMPAFLFLYERVVGSDPDEFVLIVCHPERESGIWWPEAARDEIPRLRSG